MRAASVDVGFAPNQILDHLKFAAMRGFPKHRSSVGPNVMDPLWTGFKDFAHAINVALCRCRDSDLQKVADFACEFYHLVQIKM